MRRGLDLANGLSLGMECGEGWKELGWLGYVWLWSFGAGLHLAGLRLRGNMIEWKKMGKGFGGLEVVLWWCMIWL